MVYTTRNDMFRYYYFSIMPTIFKVTSSDNNETLSFIFVANAGDLEITKTTSFDFNSMYITTFVTIKSIINDPIEDFFCKSIFNRQHYSSHNYYRF